MNTSTPLNSTYNVCYSSLEACIEASKNCSTKGFCQNFSTDSKSLACFQCVCFSGSSGPFCEYEDFTEPFWILSFCIVALFIIVAASLSYFFSTVQSESSMILQPDVCKED